jgi:hypothetical protein
LADDAGELFSRYFLKSDFAGGIGGWVFFAASFKSGLWSNYFSQAGSLCHSEAMTHMEKLLTEFIALPKCPVEIV